jgi:hypothetical protein
MGYKGIIDTTWNHVSTLFGGAIDDLQINPQANVFCNVLFGDDENFRWANVNINTWVSENHLLWYLCASLSDSRVNEAWANTFEDYYRVEYGGLSMRLSWARGPERFLLYSRPPPIQLAMFSYTAPGADESETLDFPIRATPATTRPSGDLLRLLNFIYGGQFPATGRFTVTLYEYGIENQASGYSPTPGAPPTPSFSPITQLDTPSPPPYSLITQSSSANSHNIDDDGNGGNGNGGNRSGGNGGNVAKSPPPFYESLLGAIGFNPHPTANHGHQYGSWPPPRDSIPSYGSVSPPPPAYYGELPANVPIPYDDYVAQHGIPSSVSSASPPSNLPSSSDLDNDDLESHLEQLPSSRSREGSLGSVGSPEYASPSSSRDGGSTPRAYQPSNSRSSSVSQSRESSDSEIEQLYNQHSEPQLWFPKLGF